MIQPAYGGVVAPAYGAYGGVLPAYGGVAYGGVMPAYGGVVPMYGGFRGGRRFYAYEQ